MPRLFFALCLVSAVALAQQPKAGGPPPGMPPGMMKPDIGAAPTGADLTKTLYALGVSVGTNLEDFALSDAEVKEVIKGIQDKLGGKPLAVKLEEYGPKIRPLVLARRMARGEKEKKKGDEYLARAAKEAGAKKEASGLIFRDEKVGAGASPAATDTVSVHYRGTLIDGTEFDSSYKRNAPAEFPLNGVIRCWTEGVGKMKVGGKARLVCPPEIAYGPEGRPGIPPNAVLIFEVELLSIKAKQP